MKAKIKKTFYKKSQINSYDDIISFVYIRHDYTLSSLVTNEKNIELEIAKSSSQIAEALVKNLQI